MEWFTLKVSKGLDVKLKYSSLNVQLYLLDVEGNFIKVSIEDIKSDSYYEVYSDMGKIKLTLIEFV